MERKNLIAVIMGFIIIFSLVLVACTAPTIPTAPGSEEAAPAQERAEVLVIALSQEPDTMYSLVATMSPQRMVASGVNEPFHWSRGYDFQGNMNLWDQWPTLENGAVVDDGGTA